MNLPLKDIIVLEFCQFMAGPSAGLRLADLGARVIKIERPDKGEAGRQIAIKNLFVDDSSLVFQTVNRNKESFAANLKDETDLLYVKKLIAKADVMTHNFRPGVMEKIGLTFKDCKQINSKIIYASITGYGTEGPWKNKPGQDLLLQSISGLTYLTGHQNDAPTPMGLAVADMYCGTHLVQGILAALIRRNRTNLGCHVEVSLLESILDLQFEVLTTYINDEKTLPKRPKYNGAHVYLNAPYGIYKTADGHLALAMASLIKLAKVLDFNALEYVSPHFLKRKKVYRLLRNFFTKKTTKEWLAILEPEDIWCSDVYDYKKLLAHEAFKVLNFDQKVKLQNGEQVHTTRCPIQLNDEKLFSEKGAPRVGEHTQQIMNEFNLAEE
ncbi:CaiB/BaiF CoA transferase family protein [Polaribacter marinivivus]|uniref:CaiB/BaiF CoA transferase family protein n=1 Tax=Polaribacter marinivivus TaxID=1524260 RepID=UPI003D34FAF2